MNVRFVGIDLAWKCVDPSPLSTAVCVIGEDLSVNIDLVTNDDEIISLIEDEGDCLVGIDASLKVPNQTGMRSTEKLVRRMGFKVLPTSKGYLTNMFGGSRGESLVEALCPKGFCLARLNEIPGRLVYEVFPYAAVRCMMGRSPRYKHGKLAEKKQECLNVLRAIQELQPEIQLPRGLQDEIRQANSSGVKSAADKIDSLLCAISVYRHAIYRGQVSKMIGDEENGFILLSR